MYELVKALRWCGSEDERHEMCVDESYRCPMWNEDRITDECKAELMRDAADALEAAEKRIARLEQDLKTREAERLVMQNTIEICEEAADRYKAQLPKEGEWILENYWWHCSVCGENPTRGMGYVQGKNELFKVCPNCGAKMDGGKDNADN